MMIGAEFERLRAAYELTAAYRILVKMEFRRLTELQLCPLDHQSMLKLETTFKPTGKAGRVFTHMVENKSPWSAIAEWIEVSLNAQSLIFLFRSQCAGIQGHMEHVRVLYGPAYTPNMKGAILKLVDGLWRKSGFSFTHGLMSFILFWTLAYDIVHIF